MNKIAVARNKDIPPILEVRKCIQAEQIAKIYVRVTTGLLKQNDILEIYYKFGNKLGITSTVGQVKNIYQVHGSGKKEELVPVMEAYEKDLVWIDVPGINVKLIDNMTSITRSKAKNIPVENNQGDSISVSYDEEVSKMVNYFKTELYDYFTTNKTIGNVTQDLSRSLLVQKNRLDRLAITMVNEKSSDIGAASMKMDVKRYRSSQYDVAEVNEPVKLTRRYLVAGQPVYQDDDWRICHYLLAGSKFNNDGDISCPSCSNYAKREDLLNGCNYCGTQFTIQDLSLRVAGYSQKKIDSTKIQKLQGRMDIDYALYHEANQKEYDQVLAFRMKDIDPLFSSTAFYNSMRNKLYSVVFADSITGLQNLAHPKLDVSPFYSSFENVIDIDIESIETKNIQKNDKYVLVDAVMTAMVLHYDSSTKTARWSKEIITLSFVKDINNKTKNIFEPSRIQCASCGANYSLYDGKACSFCGHEIDYLMYDWLLIDIAVKVC